MGRRRKKLSVDDVVELDMRIAAASRRFLAWFLETTDIEMKKYAITAGDKADKSIRCITALEGVKSEVTWRDELAKKPKNVSLEIYKKEREVAEERLKRILLRKKEVQITAAEEALKELEVTPPPSEETN